ncbi:MAG TPA: N,N-dimethylformamidase beta subunit family domain-containing protein, partial [Amycolatopsis sp.]|nr:N,N-dimethylformamidase beta subunit family domain-containing protein [Amycolatopsis sp.]
QGAGDFLYFELPLLRFAEQAGLPLGYATDVDLDADPHLADGAAAIVTLGHDEYWSTAMRRNTTAARDRGVNLAFLGGNEIYRHIRFQPTALGPDRLEVDYKSFADDPFHLTDPLEATPEWRSPPYPRPESVLLGDYYHCNPVHADLRVADEGNWLLAGIVHDGQTLPGLVGNEYERVDLAVPTPRPIEVLFHSPLTCGGRPDFADTSYYTTPSGAGVFAAGTQYWICALGPACAADHDNATAHEAITAITTRLLRAYAAGPAARAHPAHDNLAALGVPGATPNPAPTVPPDNSGGP